MEITIAAVADYASQSADGKLSLSGVFQIANVARSSLPIALPILYFVVQVAADASELETTINAHVEIELPNGETVPIGRAKLDAREVVVVDPRAGAYLNLILPVVGFGFALPGMHTFKCTLESGEIGRARVYVLPDSDQAQ